MVKKLLALSLCVVGLAFGQSRTSYLQLKLYTAHVDTVVAGSKTDSSLSNVGFNGNMLRIDALYHKYLDNFHDSLTALQYARWKNGLVDNYSTNKTIRTTSLGAGGGSVNILEQFGSGGQYFWDSRDSGFAGSSNWRQLNSSGLKTLVQSGLTGAGYFFISARAPLDTTSAFNNVWSIYRDTSVTFAPILSATTNQTKVAFGRPQHSLIRNNNTDNSPLMYWDVRDSVGLNSAAVQLRALNYSNLKSLAQMGVSVQGYGYFSGRAPLDTTSSFNNLFLAYRDSLDMYGTIRLADLTEMTFDRGHLYRSSDTLKFAYGTSSTARVSFGAPTSGQALVYDGRKWAPGTATSAGFSTAEKNLGTMVYPSSYTIPDSSVPYVLSITFTGVLDSVYVLRSGGTSSSVMVVKDSLGTRRDVLSAQITSSTSRTATFVNQYANISAGMTLYCFARAASGSQYLSIQVIAHQTQ